MKKEDAIAALSALAHDTRIDIFKMLVEAGPSGLAVGQIGEALNVPPATLNHHLVQLKQAGLVKVDRQGPRLIQSADFERMNDVLSFLTANCCQGQPCGPNC